MERDRNSIDREKKDDVGEEWSVNGVSRVVTVGTVLSMPDQADLPSPQGLSNPVLVPCTSAGRDGDPDRLSLPGPWPMRTLLRRSGPLGKEQSGVGTMPYAVKSGAWAATQPSEHRDYGLACGLAGPPVQH